MIEFVFLLAQLFVGVVVALWEARYVFGAMALIWLVWNHPRGRARLAAERERLARQID